jgi:putative endopeptidase
MAEIENKKMYPAPFSFRLNGAVVNMPEFATAFSCKADAAMVKAVEKVCRIW